MWLAWQRQRCFSRDCVVENAEVSIPDWTKTTDGWETTYVLSLSFSPNSLTRIVFFYRLQAKCLATGVLGLLVLVRIAKTASLPTPTASSTYVLT